MKSQFEWNRMMEQRMYSPGKVGDDSWERVHAAQKKFNESEFWHDSSALEELKNALEKQLKTWCLHRLFISTMATECFLVSIFMQIQTLRYWMRIK